jgi:hypothetical protein
MSDNSQVHHIDLSSSEGTVTTPEAAVDRIYATPEPETAEPVTNQAQGQSTFTPMKKRRFLPKKWQKVTASVLVVLLVVFAIFGVVGAYTYAVAMTLKTQAADLQASVQTTYEQFKTQNLPATEQGLKDSSEKLKVVRQTYNRLAFYNFVPFARGYYRDGLHGLNAGEAGMNAGLKSVQAITPYADVLGFAGEGSFTGGTAEDRLRVILQTLEKVTPKLDEIAIDLETVKNEMAEINANRYPENFQGRPIRSYVVQGQTVSAGAHKALTEFRPVLEQLPAAAGAKGPKKYFILFQNDNEARPTGGFLTAYAVVKVENGKVFPEKSDDIYPLDQKFKTNLPIPEKLGKYLTTERRWNMRDMNIYPDFKESMEQFLKYYITSPGEDKSINGIIAIDTHVLVDLLKTLGPVNVPGYGTFSAENEPQCDCPQIIYALSQIITRPTPYLRADRKGVLGPMMRELLNKVYGAPKTEWPKVFEIAWKNMEQRHIQAYFLDEKTQMAAESAGAAGRMKLDPNAQDFFAVVDANLGGAKSNLFINYDVRQEVSTPANGEITKKVTVTYKNNRRGDNCNLEAGLLCLNSTLRDWNRIYLPKGAKLIGSKGYRDGTVKTYDEGDFTVIDGEFTLQPLSQAKLELEYTVPYTDTKQYKVKVWKQGGLGEIPTIFDVNGSEEEVKVEKDTLYQAPF